MFRHFFILLILLFISSKYLFAELLFDNTEIREKIKYGTKEYPFSFHFSNNSNSTIKILDIVSSCDCTKLRANKKQYKPNEKGEVNGIFTIGNRTGTQEKNFIIITDEKKNSK